MQDNKGIQSELHTISSYLISIFIIDFLLYDMFLSCSCLFIK